MTSSHTSPWTSLITTATCAVALSVSSHAAVTINFDPTGEFAAQFSGAAYAESTTGGLNSSVGVALADTGPATFDGSQSESLVFTTGNSFTVGAYINMSSLGTEVGNTLGQGQLLRLGLTQGAGDNFANLPFSSIEMTDVGTTRFVGRQDQTPDASTFTLATGQWYYFETTFTRGSGTDVTYDMLIANSDMSGAIGSVLDSHSFTSSTEVTEARLDGTLYGSFKGNGGDATGVLDNFYVSNTGASAIPEPSSLGLSILSASLLLIRRRR